MSTDSACREPEGVLCASVPAHGRLEPIFDGLAQLAANACGAPFASISLVASGVTWCSAHGSLPAADASALNPFADVTARAAELLEIGDTASDERVRGQPCVVLSKAIRFYAGTALRDASAELLGTLAIFDTAPRTLTDEQRQALRLVAAQCLSQIELRAAAAERLIVTGAPPSLADAVPQSALLESAPVAIYHTDGAGYSSYMNPAYRQMFNLAADGSDAEWALGVHPDDRARVEAMWTDFRARPRRMQFEYRSNPGGRAIRYLAEQVVPVASGRGFVGTITDITELIAARENLRRIEALFRETFQQMPIGVAYAHRDGKLFRCNDALSGLLQFSAAELEARTITELAHPGDAARWGLELERLWRGETGSYSLESRYARRNGSSVWVRVTGSLVRDPEGNNDYSVAFLEDISSRKAAELSLQQSRHLIEVVVAELPVALLVCDVTGAITHHNRAATDLFGIDTDAAGTDGSSDRYPLAATVHLPDGLTPVARPQRPLARALAGETIRDMELVITPHHSSARTVLATARQLVSADGETLGAMAVFQDVTERKASEIELERVHKQLLSASRQAGMAEVATNVLHNVGNILNSINISANLVAERVKQSKAAGLSRVAALLQEKGDAVGNFLADDQRGKQIPTYLRALGDQLVSDQNAILLEVASLRENLEHIKDTVTMQQSYAKLCGVTETVKVSDLVEDAVRLNAGAFVRHGVSVLRDFADVPPVTVDKHKVLQILVNLIRNAKYACDESGRKDKLMTLRIGRSADAICISVVDNGVGILPENMERLFQHGFTTRETGHGFGLHSGALAAQELGGTLRAESAGPGQGAAFILELPLASGDSPRE